jgi:hypothetical protein
MSFVFRFPLILSLENHCSVDQQKVMAKHMTEILKGWCSQNLIPLLLLLLLQHSLLPGGNILQGVLLLQGSMSVFACHYG